MRWHELKGFHKGTDANGNARFFIPLEPDEDGLIGRECPQGDCQPRYFKIAPPALSESSEEEEQSETELDTLFCPYCGNEDRLQQFITHDQLEWAKSLLLRDMAREIQQVTKNAFQSTKAPSRKGMFSVRLIYTPGHLPSVRHYAEKELKSTIECGECKGKYAVYGISIFCPFCGKGNLALHLARSIKVISALLGMKAEIEEAAGKDSGYHLLGNCLEDCISLFEGFLKVIYSQALRTKYSQDEREAKLGNLRNSFQNVSKAETIFKDDLGYELLSNIDDSARNFLELQFAKRHVVTHNLGLVDERYRTQVASWQSAGQDVQLVTDDVKRLLSLENDVLARAIEELAR
jgi:Zn finger protein HypA/HybF involved in hydrogenase expression